MTVEVEHIFEVFIPKVGRQLTSETTKIEPGPSQALSMMVALQLNVKDEENEGKLTVGNQSLPDDYITVAKRAYPGAQSAVKMDHRQQISFTGQEILEVTSTMYSEMLKFSHKRQATTSYMGNIPPRSPA